MTVLNKRASGILLHITSLPSLFGTGDMGPEAYAFIDFLKKAGQSFWQILPLNPVSSQKKFSPYASYSAFGSNTLLISPIKLYADGFLNKKDFEDSGQSKALKKFETGSFDRQKNKYVYADYKKASALKDFLFERAYENFIKNPSGARNGFEDFVDKNSSWLNNHSRFKAFYDYFRQKTGAGSWIKWTQQISSNVQKETECLANKLKTEISKERFLQYIFHSQWNQLKKYANDNLLKIIGDLPIYIDHNSADVWAFPEIFKLDKKGMPAFLAGVPPDYFSSTGQLWKNPVYNWDALKNSGFSWWIKRMEHNFAMLDIVRIDHFRGFIAYWEVPSSCRTAVNGKWVKAYPYEFFGTLKEKFGDIPVIAENLGVITEDVEDVMKYFDFPGIKVLQFAFGSDYPHSDSLPGNIGPENVLYTGTHDNNTSRGWFEDEASDDEKRNISDFISGPVSPDLISDVFIEIAMSSEAKLSIIPMQDFMGLDSRARMNHPGTTSQNWKWQTDGEMFSDSLAAKILKITVEYGRAQLR